MKLLQELETQLASLSKQNLRRRRRTTEGPSQPRVMVDGHRMLAFCSNDYLGLAAHPKIIHAFREGASLYGAGSGASHLISGHHQVHAELEELLGNWYAPYMPDARALFFCTGYMANLAVLSGLSSLAGKQTAIFSESLNHASLIDGARLSRAEVQVYPHRDVLALQKLLEASDAPVKIVVSDSVFSMDGSLAPLPGLLALCEQHDAWLVVDDAHGFGILGEQGRGAVEHFNLHSPNLVVMGTLGKAAGVAGAFVAAHTTVIEWLLQKARPYIYTTAAPPAVAHALLASLAIIGGEEGHARRLHLQELIKHFQRELRLSSGRLLVSRTAIQPVILGENAAALAAASSLFQQGIWVPAIRPPTVPVGTARLRVTLSAAHHMDDLAILLDALSNLEVAA